MDSHLFPGNGGAGEKRKCEVWAVGGGKGGTGKTFITSSLGTALALRGRKVILIDADLGGSNLHTFFGIRKPAQSLTDFIEKRVPLEELVVPTGIGGMGLITGNLRSPDPAAVKHAQKLKLHRHIRSLEADYVLIDLGAGSHGNTLDTFLMADKLIVAITPEITAVENMYQFVKNALFRKLKMSPEIQGLKDVVQKAWANRDALGIRHLRDLVEYLRGVSPHIREIVDREMAGFEVHVVLNQVKSTQSIPLGASVRSVCIKHMGFTARYVGYIMYDDCVGRSVNAREPLLRAFPRSQCARQIERLAENFLGERQVRLTPGEYVNTGV